jgi:hypothetical protein
MDFKTKRTGVLIAVYVAAIAHDLIKYGAIACIFYCALKLGGVL